MQWSELQYWHGFQDVARIDGVDEGREDGWRRHGRIAED
jgi:hypothetical protein